MTEPAHLRELFRNTGLEIGEERLASLCAVVYPDLLGLIAAVRRDDYGDTPPATPYRRAGADRVPSRSQPEQPARIRDCGSPPIEVTEASLNRIEAVEPQLTAFVTATAELAGPGRRQ